MRLKRVLMAFLVVGLVLSMIGQSYAEDNVRAISTDDSARGVYEEIVPRLELLSGVLSQTSWIDRRGPQGKGNEYFRELKEFFSDYKNHRAVKIAEDLTQKGFTYDAPPHFVLRLGPLPKLKAVNGYGDYLIDRAHGKDNLEEFRLALVDLAQKSNFKQFFNEHRQELEGHLNQTVEDFDSKKVIRWLRKFFGWSGDEFHVVLAPAMFPGGGYAATINKDNGESIIYQVVRERGRSNKEPEFQTGSKLERLTLHEWGHSFVNPSLEKYSDIMEKLNLKKFYKPVAEEMKNQAYGSVEFFFNEQVLRAVTCLAGKDLYGKEIYEKLVKYHKRKGFYLTEFTIKQLEYYRNNRDKYKTFREFVPYLFREYNRNQERLLGESKELGVSGFINWQLIVLVLLIVVISTSIYFNDENRCV
ncbi:hypothetical protein JCM16358_17980 [Halanaerocella petrolearia]